MYLKREKKKERSNRKKLDGREEGFNKKNVVDKNVFTNLSLVTSSLISTVCMVNNTIKR